MTEDLPLPPVPSDADVRHFDRMHLDVKKLLNSDLIDLSTGEEFKAAVRLWCESWHQVPAGSLPNVDRQIQRLAGFGTNTRGWNRVREMAMRGYYLCADNRWYHPTMVAMVSSARRSSIRNRSAANKRWTRDRGGIKPLDIKGTSDATAMQVQCTRNASAMQGSKGENKGGGKEKTKRVKSKTENTTITNQFQEFYQIYPRHVGKAAALKAYGTALKHANHSRIITGVKRYAEERQGEDQQFTKHPGTWLNQRCWEDYLVSEATPEPKQLNLEPGGAENQSEDITRPKGWPQPKSPDVAGSIATELGHTPRETTDPLYQTFLTFPHLNLDDPNAWLLQFFRTGIWPEHLGPDPDQPDCLARTSAIDAARHSI